MKTRYCKIVVQKAQNKARKGFRFTAPRAIGVPSPATRGWEGGGPNFVLIHPYFVISRPYVGLGCPYVKVSRLDGRSCPVFLKGEFRPPMATLGIDKKNQKNKEIS
ncbi:MAG: hypothetical protein GY765_28965 [bacterium]|nr:hypothetical protein [bacterium]